MSSKRKLGISILALMAGLLVVGMVALMPVLESFRSIGEFFEYGYLGRPDQRQRIEAPAHGFAISFAGDWTVAAPPPDPVGARRLGMTAVLIGTPPEEGPACTMYFARAASTTPVEELLHPWLDERDPDQYDIANGEDVWGTTSGLATASLGWRDHGGSMGTAWVIPHHEDVLVLSCSFRLGDEDSPSDAVEMSLGIGVPPIVDSIELMPPPVRKANRDRG